MMKLEISDELRVNLSNSVELIKSKGKKEITLEVLCYFIVRSMLYKNFVQEVKTVGEDEDYQDLYTILSEMSAEDKAVLESSLYKLANSSLDNKTSGQTENKVPVDTCLAEIFDKALDNIYDMYIFSRDKEPEEGELILTSFDILAIVGSSITSEDEDLSEEVKNKIDCISIILNQYGINDDAFEKYNEFLVMSSFESNEALEDDNNGIPESVEEDDELKNFFRSMMEGTLFDNKKQEVSSEDKPKSNEEGGDNAPDKEEEEVKELEQAEEEFEKAGDHGAINVTPVDPNSKTPTLDQFAVNMTKAAAEGKYDPVVGREKEIEQIIEILCCRKKNNAVLTGDPGCGKSAIVESLAMKIVNNEVPVELRGKKIFSLDLNALVSGTQYRGQYEQRLQDVIKEVIKNKDIIIFVDELHNLIGNGSAQGTGDGANILKPYLARGEFQCVGSTTTDEYRKYIEKDGALKRRFSPVLVEEPTVDQTIEILKGLSKVYGKFHNVTYSEDVLKKCAIWAGKYINDRFFPDKAISVMDMASSLAKLKNQKTNYDSDILAKLEKEQKQLTNDKMEAIRAAEFERAAAIRDRSIEVATLIEQEKKRQRELPPCEVTINDVSSVIAKISNVPIDTIMSSDLEKVKVMRTKMEEKIIGQSEAVKQLTLALQRNIFGLRDPKKPIASFLLVGPTGVGKTLISKLIAQEFMGNESNLITIACSEYMQDWAESKLLGSAPGYVGYTDSEPRLYVLKRKPYSVVLIDEVEKSSSNLYNIWLNMLEEGEITLSSGEKVSCRNSIIIFTGNVGTKALEIKGNGLGFVKLEGKDKKQADEATVMKEVNKEFRPEFLNRLTKVIVFNSLGNEELEKIFWLELKKLQDRIKESQGYEITVDDKIKDLIVSKCEPKYGARSLQRYITEYIEDNINNAFLEQDNIGDKKNITLTLKEEEEVDVVFS